jgi:RNA polymerase sigma-70 factor, ECF subfamily
MIESSANAQIRDVAQRFVNGWSDRRKRSDKRRLVPTGHSGTITEPCLSLYAGRFTQRSAGKHAKSGTQLFLHKKAAMPQRNENMSVQMVDGAGRSDLADALEQEHLSPAAFATRFQSAWPTLWAIAVAVLGDRTGADDVLQEAAVIALEKLEQFDPQTNFAAWMGRIVRFVALNHGRRRSNSVASPLDPASLDRTVSRSRHADSVPLTNRGQMTADQADFDDRVIAALNMLDETARACLLLRTLMNMPYREISLVLDIAEGTAMSHVHRARTALRERLSGSGHTSMEVQQS